MNIGGTLSPEVDIFYSVDQFLPSDMYTPYKILGILSSSRKKIKSTIVTTKK